MRALLIASLLSLIIALPAAADVCADAQARYDKLPADAKAPPGATVVKMYQYTFCPPELTVAAGTTVHWINVERTSHTVWLKEAGQPETDRLFLGEGWKFTFSQPGTFDYLCGPHGEQEKMRGRVTVTP